MKLHLFKFAGNLKIVAAVITFCVLLWTALRVMRHREPRAHHLLVVTCSDKGLCTLSDVSLATEQMSVLFTFPSDTKPLNVTYAPIEKRIGVLADADEHLEFDLFNLAGTLLKRTPVPTDGDMLTRPYYRQGLFLFSASDTFSTVSAFAISAVDGSLRKQPFGEKLPKSVNELLLSYERALIPDDNFTSYLFCYAPLVPTRRIGTRRYAITDPQNGKVCKYLVTEGRICPTLLSAKDLLPAHGPLVALYSSPKIEHDNIAIMDVQQRLLNRFSIDQSLENMRWSPADTKISVWYQDNGTVYSAISGKEIAHFHLDIYAIDWDWRTEMPE